VGAGRKCVARRTKLNPEERNIARTSPPLHFECRGEQSTRELIEDKKNDQKSGPLKSQQGKSTSKEAFGQSGILNKVEST